MSKSRRSSKGRWIVASGDNYLQDRGSLPTDDPIAKPYGDPGYFSPSMDTAYVFSSERQAEEALKGLLVTPRPKVFLLVKP